MNVLGMLGCVGFVALVTVLLSPLVLERDADDRQYDDDREAMLRQERARKALERARRGAVGEWYRQDDGVRW